jgi:hypothetical protein
MTATISQRVRFSTSAETLFEMYMDSKKHAASTGAPAKLSRKVGGASSAYGGSIGGENCSSCRTNKLCERGAPVSLKKGELSILIMTFEKAVGGAIGGLVHVGVPQHDQKGVRHGWLRYYWKPWQKYLRAGKKK